MAEDIVSRVPVWQIPRVNPGFLYIVQSGERLKIGKSKNRSSRLRAAKTWLPDMTLIGVKPFWLIDDFEKELHIGLAQWWYEGEWFFPDGDPYLEWFIENFCAFSDDENQRDMNSVNFLYWMHEMLDLTVEYARRGMSVKAFQRDVSEVKKDPK